jgi:SAM-dependent methyltransferase
MEINEAFQTLQTAQKCYDERYADGYMEHADREKVSRIRQILRNTALPKSGAVLDFGCGSGAFTAILQEELPGWTVYGTELSPVALDKAKQCLPNAIFETLEDCASKHKFFDVIFTHHVLEHVQDVDKTFALFSHLAKERSWLLHICPCGNPGSFEHTLCLMREDGIGPGNRFFFEDPSHLRRLTTDDIRTFGKRHGNFTILDGYYANQHYGALNWISSQPYSFWRELFDFDKVRTFSNKARMLFYKHIAMPACNISNGIIRLFLTANPSSKRQLLRFVLLPSLPIVKFFSTLHRARQEWESSSKQQNGSEMYIVLRRG